jgi:hypothetical protein
MVNKEASNDSQAARDRQFVEHLDYATSIVSRWPEWKRNVLGGANDNYHRQQKESKGMRSRLFVIKKRGQNQYWNNSSEHGCGWNDRYPKQSFSPSELTKGLRLLIDQGWFVECEIIELRLPATVSDGTDDRKEVGA